MKIFMNFYRPLLKAWQRMMNSPKYQKVFLSSVAFKNTDFGKMWDLNFRLCYSDASSNANLCCSPVLLSCRLEVCAAFAGNRELVAWFCLFIQLVGLENKVCGDTGACLGAGVHLSLEEICISWLHMWIWPTPWSSPLASCANCRAVSAYVQMLNDMV